jgi:mannose/fructose-specific phosphotransferase system component IIA
MSMRLVNPTLLDRQRRAARKQQLDEIVVVLDDLGAQPANRVIHVHGETREYRVYWNRRDGCWQQMGLTKYVA